jgi:heme oxygenase
MFGPLWQATRDLHHQAEEHPLARAMITGTITPQAWADWLQAHLTIQLVLDPHLPLAVRRADALALDLLALLPVEARPSPAAAAFAATLTDAVSIFGAAYLTIGAHRRGGRVIEKALREARRDLPSRHTAFDDGPAAEAFVKQLREIPDLAPGARQAFAALMEVMDEIVARGNLEQRCDEDRTALVAAEPCPHAQMAVGSEVEAAR